MIKARRDVILTFVSYFFSPHRNWAFIFFLNSSFLHLICFCSLSRGTIIPVLISGPHSFLFSQTSKRGQKMVLSLHFHAVFGGACDKSFFPSPALMLPASQASPTHGSKLSWAGKTGACEINMKKQMS